MGSLRVRGWVYRVGVMAVFAAFLAVTVAACGSDSDDGTADAGSTTAAETGADTTTAAAPTGEPLVIGSICSCSGAVSATTAAIPDVFKAWEERTNANGGINGHPVEVVVIDDALDAATTTKAIKELVEQKNVIAIVGETSNLDSLWENYVKNRGIPVVGAMVPNVSFEKNPVFFPQGAQNPAQVFGIVQHAKEEGTTKIAALYCAESPSCATYGKLFEEEGRIVGGVELVSWQKITATQPNYTAQCLAAKEAGADMLVTLHSSPIVVSVAEDCANQGYTPAQANLSFVPGPEWKDDPNLQGVVTFTPNQSLWDESIPATKEFQEALDEYAPGTQDRPEFNPSNASVWASAEIFKLAAERAKLTPQSTPADVMKGLHTFKDETLDGLTAPLTYPEGPPQLVPCVFVSAIENEEWVAPNGAEPQCIPEEYREEIEGLMVRE